MTSTNPQPSVREAVSLKPCPFCGGEATLRHDSIEDAWDVCCYVCDVRHAAFTEADDAVAVWNQRAPTQPEALTHPEASRHADDPRDTAWSQGQHSPGPWACYHCSFTAYTHEEAREHFGPDRWGVAACQAVTTHRERIERIISDPKAASRVMFLLEAMARSVPAALSHPDPLTVPETRQPTGLPPLVNGALFCGFCGKGAQQLRSGELWAGINPRYACICVDCARSVLETAAPQLTVPETSRQGSSGADIAARVASDLAAGEAPCQSERETGHECGTCGHRWWGPLHDEPCPACEDNGQFGVGA